MAVVNSTQKRKHDSSNSSQSSEGSHSYKPRQRSRGATKPPEKKKGRWSADEDKKLLALIRAFEKQNPGKSVSWDEIERGFLTRTKKQCRERWLSQLDPTLRKVEWTEDEDRQLLYFAKLLNKKWAEIARRIQGRTENMVKNRWHALNRNNNNADKSSSKRAKTWTTKPAPQLRRSNSPLLVLSDYASKPWSQKRGIDSFKPSTDQPKPAQQKLSRLLFDKNQQDFAKNRNNSLEFFGSAFGEKSDVLERHPSFDVPFDFNDGSDRMNRQSSFDFLARTNSSNKGSINRQVSFDKAEIPFGENLLALEGRQHSLTLERGNSLLFEGNSSLNLFERGISNNSDSSYNVKFDQVFSDFKQVPHELSKSAMHEVDDRRVFGQFKEE